MLDAWLKGSATEGFACSCIQNFREFGPAIDGCGWFGLFAPARTPTEVVARMSWVIVAEVPSPAGHECLESFEMEYVGSTPEELVRIIRADLEDLTPIVKASEFTPSN